VYFEPSLRFEQLDDARPEFAGFGTIHYGPLLLAGLSESDTLLLPNTSVAAVRSVIHRDSASSESLRFVAITSRGGCAAAPNLTLIPLNEVRTTYGGARYTTYFHTKPKHFAKTTVPGMRALDLSTAADFILQGGAQISSACAAEAEAHTAADEAHDNGHGGHWTHLPNCRDRRRL
jgi:hypothetical protein